MDLLGIKCPKCGLMQLPRPACKSCGKPLNISPSRHPSSLPVPPKPAIPTPTPSPIAPKIMPTQVNGEMLVKTLEQPAVQPNNLPAQNKRGPGNRLTFNGSGGELLGIYIVNIFLTILTLGIYYFWGKARVQSYLMNETEFEGDRFAYHGTGKEMLIGFLKAVLVFIIPVVLLNLLPELLGAPLMVKRGANIAAYSLFIFFIPVAMVGARRYRLSRTSWRVIRFSFRGKAWDFVKLFLRGSFFTVLSLGLYYPFFDAQKYEFIISNSYFGNRRFHFSGKGRELFRPYLLALLLTIPTLGFCWFWYLAKKKRFFWKHTSFGSVGFCSTITGRCLMNLYLGNFLLLIITLGLGWPWVVVRKTKIAFKYLTLNGSLDLAEVQQEAQGASATGEALAGFLDAGFDLG